MPLKPRTPGEFSRTLHAFSLDVRKEVAAGYAPERLRRAVSTELPKLVEAALEAKTPASALAGALAGGLLKGPASRLERVWSGLMPEEEPPADRSAVLQDIVSRLVWSTCVKLCLAAAVLHAFLEKSVWEREQGRRISDGAKLARALGSLARKVMDSDAYAAAENWATSDGGPLREHLDFRASLTAYPLRRRLGELDKEAAEIELGFKAVWIAWTFDDGPSGFSKQLRADFEALTKTNAATWYLCRDMVPKFPDALPDIVKRKAEAAIHSMDPKRNHTAWFNALCETDKKTGKPAGNRYEKIADAMRDLAAFHAELKAAGLPVKFTRIPYGLVSELTAYLRQSGVPSPDPTARKLIAGDGADLTASDIPGATAKQVKAANAVAADFREVLKTLGALKAHEWSGAAKLRPLAGQSWETESSGAPNRNDTVTRNLSPVHAAGKAAPRVQKETQQHKGAFEGLARKVAADSLPRSLVVLAHDTSQADVDEIKADIAEMLEQAKAFKVAVRFVTMSELFRFVMQREP